MKGKTLQTFNITKELTIAIGECSGESVQLRKCENNTCPVDPESNHKYFTTPISAAEADWIEEVLASACRHLKAHSRRLRDAEE